MSTEKTNTPSTVEELCDYIARHAKDIYIRYQLENGEWEPVSLTELPTDVAISRALEFVSSGQIPHLIVNQQGLVNEE